MFFLQGVRSNNWYLYSPYCSLNKDFSVSHINVYAETKFLRFHPSDKNLIFINLKSHVYVARNMYCSVHVLLE